MSKKMEGKQNAPSVLARLMGIDELPPQQPSHRQLKVLSENYLRKTASIGMLEKSSLLVSRLSRKTAKKHHAVKHVFGSEIPKNEKGSIQSIPVLKPNQGNVRAQLTFGRQRNAYAKKYHSVDKKLYQAEEHNDVLEDLHVTRDNSLRYFKKSNLSTNQIHVPKVLELHLGSGHLTAPIFPSVPTYTDSELSNKSGKTSTQTKFLRSIQKLENSCREFDTESLSELSEIHSELKDKAGNFSTQIVVLKPNSRQTQDSVMELHLHRSDILHQKGDMEYREYGELLKCQSRELNAKVTETEKTTSDMEPPGYSFTDPQQVEKKAAKQEWKSISSSQRDASISRITIEDSSVHAPEALMTSSEGSLHCKNRERISNPFPSGSFFAREAKKQIFERWKTTKSFEEVKVSGRRCNLGQMFAMQDGEARPKSLYSKLGKNCFSNPFCLEKEISGLGSYLAFSRKVNSTNEYIRNLPRFKHLKNSSIATETTNFETMGEASQNGCVSGQKEAVTDKHHKLKSENFYRKDSLESRDSTVSCEKQLLHRSADLEGSHNPNYKLSSSNILSSVSDDTVSLRVNQVIQDDLQEDLHKEADGHSSSDVWDNLAEQKSSCDSPGEELILRCTAKDSQLAINLREINQPSPDSVLEPPLMEENLPGSDFFESPISDLSGLAMKLHLLHPESEETNSEGSGMAVSSDEDTEKGSLDLSEDNEKLWGMLRPEESRNFSYLVDVLDEANLCGMDLDICHGTEFPMSPPVFEALEKKYGKQTSWAKSERRLLFDHMNSGLREILDSCMDFCMSTKPLRRRLNSTLTRDEIEEELWMLLSQDKEVSKDLAEKALGGEMKWMELEGDVSIICREIVEYLFDELATEFCCSEGL